MGPDDAYREYRHAKRTLKAERLRLRSLKALTDAAAEAQAIIQSAARDIQGRAQRQVSALVSRCLAEVFGEHAYEFRLELEAKRGKTEARPVFVRGKRVLDPVDESGLGQVDVASFALRLAAVLLHVPPLRLTLVLDEPFKFVSAEYLPRVRDLLDGLAADLGVQMVLTTHNKELETGNVIRV